MEQQIRSGASAAVAERPRGSREGADGVYYPAEEERAVPLGDAALRMLAYLCEALRRVFSARSDVYVGGDQFIYWEPGNPRKRIAPDVYVIFGVPSEPPRAVIRTWEENVPAFVVEISSKESRAGDRGHKLEIYQNVLRCPEYLIYDEELDELLLYRLEDEGYQRVEPQVDGSLYSEELGVRFTREAEILVRLYGADGQPVPNYAELAQEAAQERRRRLELEQELARLRQRTDSER